MTKKIPVLVLGAGVAIALIISLASYAFLNKKAQNRFRSQEVVDVAVAGVDMPWGTVLTKAVVKSAPYLRKSLPDGYHVNAAEIEGRVLIQPIRANQPIFESSLAQSSIKNGGIAAVVRPNKRAMAVKVDNVVGVSGFIYPGNRVDVLVTLKDRADYKNIMTKIVLDNVLVLAAGSEVETTGKQEKPTKVDVITLEVTPEEGEKLALAATEGKLQLALRNSGDTAKVATRGTTIPVLLSSDVPGNTKPVPKVKPSGTQKRAYSVEVIHGGRITNLIFEGGNQ
jgi:pilus assembly protein CpaB